MAIMHIYKTISGLILSLVTGTYISIVRVVVILDFKQIILAKLR